VAHCLIFLVLCVRGWALSAAVKAVQRFPRLRADNKSFEDVGLYSEGSATLSVEFAVV
jgi:hypothetical protein